MVAVGIESRLLRFWCEHSSDVTIEQSDYSMVTSVEYSRQERGDRGSTPAVIMLHFILHDTASTFILQCFKEEEDAYFCALSPQPTVCMTSLFWWPL